jgi:hypothetical protein
MAVGLASVIRSGDWSKHCHGSESLKHGFYHGVGKPDLIYPICHMASRKSSAGGLGSPRMWWERCVNNGYPAVQPSLSAVK